MNNNFQGGFQNGGFQQGGFASNGFQQPPQQQQQQGQQQNRSGFNSHVKIQVIGNLTRDPESQAVGQSKVASTTVAINHKGNDAPTDFWDIEIWANQGQSTGYHDFLMDYCKKGRQVFIEGVPYLKRRKRQANGQDVLDQNGKAVYDYYPTIRVQTIVGLQGGQSQAQQQNQQPVQSQQPQGTFQPGFNAQPQGAMPPPQGFGAPQAPFQQQQ